MPAGIYSLNTSQKEYIIFHMKTATKSRTSSAAAKSTASRSTQNGGGKKANPATKAKVSENGSAEQKEQTPFEKLFEDLLKDIYWAELHLVKALQKMSEAATTPELQDAFEDHLYTTKKHASRLERVFKLIGKPAQGKKCAAMEGLTEEADEIIKNTEDGTMTRDAGLIIAAQKVEHYEIASYGSLVQVALTLGYDEAAHILERTLNEEEKADHTLTIIAETHINPMADQEGMEEEEVEEAATVEE